MTIDYTRLTATEIISLGKSGSLKVEDLVKALIKRIELRDPIVQAWAFFDSELVLKNARELDAIPLDRRGPLHGVPIAVKDMIYTKDMPTQHGSPIYKGSLVELDAAPVQTLRAAGALIFGKTHTTEFATCQKGSPCCNPHDPTRTPGGSSSGSGAVVGDYQAPISLGTQTGGSTIRPAAYNGIYALKSTWNSISREGLKIYSLTCDTLGLYGRSVADLKLLAEVFALKDDIPPPEQPLSLKGAKFGFVKTSVWPKATKGTQDAWELGAKLLEEAGAEVEHIELPEDFAKIAQWHAWILAGEGRAAFLSEYVKNKKLLDPLIIDAVENASGMTRANQLEAYDGVSRLRPVIDAIANKYDALVTPSVTDEAPLLVEPMRFTGDASFNSMWTVLHTPVVNIPGFKGPSGCPLGLSLVAARYNDLKLLRVAEAVGQVWQAKGGWKPSV